ncbi:MAG: hypothetical protein IE931_08950 [Sphingobacteriales bacterium]|nr:hypothetical protein [Sphingobacteriales bacterium]
MLTKIIKLLINLLVIILLIDPADLIFHLKVPLFLLVFTFWIFLKTKYPIKFTNDFFFICVIFIFIPFIGISFALIQQNLDDYTFAVGFIKSAVTIFLIMILYDLKINLSYSLFKFSLLIPIIIIPIYVSLLIDSNLIIQINEYVKSKDIAKFSRRNFYGYEIIMLYYRTSPLLVFPLAFYMNAFLYGKKKKISFIFSGIFLFTLILSGTRANMLAGVTIIVFCLFSYLIKKKNKFPLVFMTLISIYIIITFIRTLSFKQTDESSHIKSEHLNSYISLFEQNPHYLLFGSGLGSKFYSSGNGYYVSQTELTYLDLIRWFGIPITLIFLLLILYPVIYLSSNKLINNKNSNLIIAYFSYLFIAGTNPLLVSSTGMLAIITMYSSVAICKREVEN